MKAQKAKMKGNESSKAKMQKPKCKEMKAHKAKMKRNEDPKGQKLENWAGPGAAKFFVWEIGKTDHFWQLVGGGNPSSWPAKQPKCKEIKAYKAKMKGNEGPQGQNARKSRLKAHKAKKKEMKAQKAKIKGNEGPKFQKLENGAGPGAAKFFVWEIGKTG